MANPLNKRSAPTSTTVDTGEMEHNEFEGAKVRLRAVEPEDWELWYSDSTDTDLTRRGGVTHLPLSRAAKR